MSSLVAEIEERLEVLEDQLAKVAPIVYERERLISARAQLLGEPPPPPATAPRRITREDVVSVLCSHAGIRAGEIARVLGAGQPAISAHLYRGKGTRFRSRGGGGFSSTRSDAIRPMRPEPGQRPRAGGQPGYASTSAQ
jgi:DNA-binding transcriptional ArsR family regulator